MPSTALELLAPAPPREGLREASHLQTELIERCMGMGSTAAFARANDLNVAHVNKVIAINKRPCAELVRALGYRPVTFYQLIRK